MLNTTPPLSIRPAPRSAVLCPSRRGTTPTTDASSGERPGTAIDPRWARAGSPLTPGGGLAGGGGSSGGEDGMSLSTTSRPPSASAGGHHGSPRAMPLGMPSPSSELSLAPPYESLSGEELATMACEREREQEPNHMTGRYGRYPRFAALTQPYTAPADVPNGDTPSGVRDESLVISPPSRSSLFLSDGDGLPPILPTAAQPQPVPPIMMPSNNVRRNALIARSTRPRRYPKPSPLVHVTVQHIYKDVGHNNPTANALPQPYNPTSSTSSSRGDQSGRGESSCGSSEERERPPRDSPRRPARGGGALVMLRFSDDSSATPPPRSTADAVCRPSILVHPTAPSIQFTPVASTEKYAAPNDEQADQHRRSYPMMHHQSTRCHSLRHALSWWWWSIWQLLWYINIVLLTFLVLGCGAESMIFHRQP